MTDEQPLSRRDARAARDAAGFPAAPDAPSAAPVAGGPASVPGVPQTGPAGPQSTAGPQSPTGPQNPTGAPSPNPTAGPAAAPNPWDQPTVAAPTVAAPFGGLTPTSGAQPPAAPFDGLRPSAAPAASPAEPQPTVLLPGAAPMAALGGTAATTVLGDGAAARAEAPAEAAEGKGGIAALVRKHPTAWIATASALAFALLGTGAVFAGVAFASQGAEPVATPTPTVTEEPPRATSGLPATASRLRTCSIADVAADPRLATLYGSVVRADTGEVLFDRNAGSAAAPASVMKLLTAAAAVQALGPDYRIRTSVVDGSSAGTVVLVGRGDATLSALPAGQESVYKGAPKLQTLAEQTIAAYASRFGEEDEIVPISKLVLDATYWNAGDAWDPTWREDQRTRGYQSAATALQVDGDRADPRRDVSARGYDPITTAGEKFVQALKAADVSGDFVADDVQLATGGAVPNATELAFVESQPVRTLVAQMLLPSDNTLGEMLARIVSVNGNMGGTASSLQNAIVGQLGTWGVPTAGIVIKDGSGLSPANAVPPAAVTTLLRHVWAGNDNLDAVRDGLSVAGQSGTLRERFTGDNAVGRGNVMAKSGMITGSYSLAGQLTAADGIPLVFAFYAVGEGVDSPARSAIDTLTTAALRCGDNLSNN